MRSLRESSRVRQHLIVSLALVGSLAGTSGEAPFGRVSGFVDYRNHSGPRFKESIRQMTGAGICVIDYDLDGDFDLFFPDGGGSDRLFRNLAENGERRFSEITAAAEITDSGWSGGCAVGDIDNDGDPDLYVTNQGPNALFRNNGDGTFSRLPRAAAVDDAGWSTSAAFGDLDGDGLLDLYVCNYIDLARADLRARCRYFGIEVFCGPNGLPGAADSLFQNRDGSAFEDVTRPAGVYSPETRGFTVLLTDLDDDGRPDIYVANDATINLLFGNLGGMRFIDHSLASGAGYSGVGVEQSGMGLTAGDFDGDGDLDLYVTNFQRDYNTLYRNEGRFRFSDITEAAGLSLPTLHYLGWGAHFLDVANDGVLDLFVANGHIYSELEVHPEIGEPYAQPNQLFLGAEKGRFEEALLATEVPRKLGRGTALVDLDRDGALDVAVNALDDAPDLYRGRPAGNWIRFQLVGTKSNRDGLNARIRIAAAGVAQRAELRLSDGYAGSNEPAVHFGVGRAEVVEEVVVQWPSGLEERFENLPARQEYLLKEGVGFLP
jgi:hypothetical protein